MAALGVLGFHSVSHLIGPQSGRLAAWLLNGWAGVAIFFPISGYCILAASHGRHNGAWAFLKRRWIRIYPTYWASIAVAIGLTMVYRLATGGDALKALVEPGAGWLALLTLTQTVFGMSSLINPVYWSLCYEEQFYLIVALTMLVHARRRPLLLLGITMLATIAYAVPVWQRALPAGLFIDQWVSFAVGLAAFGWSDERYGRPWSLAIFTLAGIAELATARVDLGISIAVAVAFVALRQYDEPLSGTRPISWLAAIGGISYSLYLVHVPIVSRVTLLAQRVLVDASQWWAGVTGISVLAALAGAVVFHAVVEKRFQIAASAAATPLRPEVAVA